MTLKKRLASEIHVHDCFLYVVLTILALCLLGWIISQIPMQVMKPFIGVALPPKSTEAYERQCQSWRPSRSYARVSAKSKQTIGLLNVRMTRREILLPSTSRSANLTHESKQIVRYVPF